MGDDLNTKVFLAGLFVAILFIVLSYSLVLIRSPYGFRAFRSKVLCREEGCLDYFYQKAKLLSDKVDYLDFCSIVDDNTKEMYRCFLGICLSTLVAFLVFLLMLVDIVSSEAGLPILVGASGYGFSFISSTVFSKKSYKKEDSNK